MPRPRTPKSGGRASRVGCVSPREASVRTAIASAVLCAAMAACGEPGDAAPDVSDAGRGAGSPATASPVAAPEVPARDTATDARGAPGGSPGEAAAGAPGTVRDPRDEAPPPPVGEPPRVGPWFVTSDDAASGFTHRTLAGPTALQGKFFLRDTVGPGVAVLDVDGDGDMDLYFPQGTDGTAAGGDSANRLYLNDGTGRFTEDGAARGAAHRGYGFGALAFDWDADGDTDLFLTNLGPDVLLRNDDGRFTDVTADHPGLAGPPTAWSVGAAAGDLDLDGDLDLYVAGYCEQDLPALEARGWCRQMSCEVPCGPRSLRPEPDRVHRNSGAPDFTLTADAGDTGLLDVEPSYGFQPTFTDIDDDGDLDLYVTNDSVANTLFVNDGRGRFEEAALVAGVACGRAGQMEAGMGLAVGHADDDALPELYVTNFSTQSNSLYWNESDLLGQPWFEEISQRAGLGRPSWFQLGWGCAFADFDGDGFTDVFSSNGHIFPQMDGCDPELVVYRQANSVYRGTAEPGVFDDVSAAAGLTEESAHRSAALVDVDGDGRLDLVVTRMDASPRLLRNRTPAHGRWFGARVLHVPPGGDVATDAVGARVTVHAGGRRWTRDVTAGSSFLATEDPRVHVGLGALETVDRVEVRVPGGTTLAFETPPVGTWTTLVVRDGALRLAEEDGR